MKGSYVLLIKLKEPEEAEVGSLGSIRFKKGFYAYVGSAMGSGGFKRVERHRTLSETCGERYSIHWHIDYLLTMEGSEIVDVFKVEGEDVECQIASKIGLKEITGFGCTDCNCLSHLFYADTLKNARKNVEKAVEEF